MSLAFDLNINLWIQQNDMKELNTHWILSKVFQTLFSGMGAKSKYRLHCSLLWTPFPEKSSQDIMY